MTTPDLLDAQRRFTTDLIQLWKDAHAEGLNTPLLAKLLLDQSFESAMHGELQEMFDHMLWVGMEAERMLGEFDKRLGPKLDQEALARGIIKPKGHAA